MLKKDRVFICLSASGIKLFSRNPKHDLDLDFEAGLFEYQEITDHKKYKSILSSLVGRIPDTELILLIANEFTYHKKIPPNLQHRFHEEKEYFINMIPFEETKIAYTHIDSAGGTEIIAVNKEIYEPFLSAIRQGNKKILHIIPLSLIHSEEDLELSFKTLNSKYSKKLFKKYDLGLANKGIPRVADLYQNKFADEEKTEFQINPKIILASVFLIIAFGVLIFTVFSVTNIGKKTIPNNTPTNASTFLPSLTPTPEPTIIYKQLNELTVQIYNGSNIAGQATKLKSVFSEIGLIGIETSNYQLNNLRDISMTLSPNVSSSDSALLLSSIEATFPELIVNQISTPAADFDITIVIGNKFELE